MILVDTSVWIDFLRGADSPQRRLLHRLLEEDGEISITGIVLTEVLQGVREDKDFRLTRDYLLEFPSYEPRGIFTYLGAARIYRECRKRGKSLRSTVDCVIAAICLENGFAILHRDRDFDVIGECSRLRVLQAG